MKKIAVCAAMLGAMTGCATSPIPAEQAKPVPPDRLYSYQHQADGSALLIVTRDTGLMGSACNTKFFINGRLSAEIGPGESARFYLPAGESILGADGAGICSGGLKEREVQLSSGGTKRYRLSIDTSMSMDLSPTAM